MFVWLIFLFIPAPFLMFSSQFFLTCLIIMRKMGVDGTTKAPTSRKYYASEIITALLPSSSFSSALKKKKMAAEHSLRLHGTLWIGYFNGPNRRSWLWGRGCGGFRINIILTHWGFSMGTWNILHFHVENAVWNNVSTFRFLQNAVAGIRTRILALSSART